MDVAGVSVRSHTSRHTLQCHLHAQERMCWVPFPKPVAELDPPHDFSANQLQSWRAPFNVSLHIFQRLTVGMSSLWEHFKALSCPTPLPFMFSPLDPSLPFISVYFHPCCSQIQQIQRGLNQASGKSGADEGLGGSLSYLWT